MKTRALKVPVLHYQPPADPEDPVVGQIVSTLQALGHKPTRFAVERDVRSLLNGVARGRPDLVFNICETFANRNIFEVNVAAFLELMEVPFTGSGTGGLLLAQDKALAKKLFTFHRVPCPDFAVFHGDNLAPGGQLRFPLFVKPLRADASIGVAPESLVNTFQELIDRVRYVHSLGEAAIAEEYIEGRELYVGVLGGERPMALPVVELHFRAAYPKGRPAHRRLHQQVREELARVQGHALGHRPDQLGAAAEGPGARARRLRGAAAARLRPRRLSRWRPTGTPTFSR